MLWIIAISTGLSAGAKPQAAKTTVDGAKILPIQSHFFLVTSFSMVTVPTVLARFGRPGEEVDADYRRGLSHRLSNGKLGMLGSSEAQLHLLLYLNTMHSPGFGRFALACLYRSFQHEQEILFAEIYRTRSPSRGLRTSTTAIP